MIEKLYLIDRNPELVEAWRSQFRSFTEVAVLQGDYFQKEASVIVSPANSFGFMDGGLDLAIRDRLGESVERELQNQISQQYHGELPIGHCLTIETGSSQWPHLAAIPTMRVPSIIQGTLNVYYAFRALLLCSIGTENAKFNSVLCPGLGTGVGGVSPENCAGQMAFAYKQFVSGGYIPTAREVLKNHSELESYK